MKTLNKSEVVAREYDHQGKKGTFILHRETGARCLLEGTAARFFEIACGNASDVEKSLSDLAVMFGAEKDKVLADYDGFVAGLEKTLKNDDKAAGNKLLPALYERGITSLIMLELLQSCNLKCIHCYVGHRGAEGVRQSLVVKNLETLKQRLIKMGCADLTVTGGEIRLVPGIISILKDLSRDFVVTALTNGTMWTEEDCLALVSVPLKEIRTTLFSSDPKVHDGITKEPGSWQKTYDFAMRLKQLNVPVRINTPVLSANIAGVPELMEKLKQAGLSAVVDVKCLQAPGIDNCRASAPQLTELFKTGIPAKLLRTQCGGIRYKMRIGPDGSIFPCEYLSDKIGDIFRDQTREEVLSSGLSKKLLQTMNQEPACGDCADCAAKGSCFHCVAFNYSEHGDHLKPSGYICGLNRISVMAGNV